MKIFTGYVVALLFLCLGVNAEEPVPAFSVSSDFTYTSQYFFRGVKNQEQAFQPSVTLTSGDFSAGIWVSQSLDKKGAAWAQGREIDFVGGYSRTIHEKYTISVSGTYYYYPLARPSLSEPKSTNELYLTLGGPMGPLTGKFTAPVISSTSPLVSSLI